MATPKKKGKSRVSGKRDKKKKTSNSYEVKPHRYGVTFNTGSPAYYDNPDDMAKEIDTYFDWIKGEVGERQVKIGKRTTKEQYWVREPEPPTITGLALYLGFSCIQSLDKYMNRGPKFSAVVKRGKTRVEHRYERNLSSDKPTGAIFALKNMGWKDGNFLADLTDDSVVVGFQYIVPKKPKDDETE